MQGINATDERTLIALATIERTLSKHYDKSMNYEDGNGESALPTMTQAQVEVLADDTRIDTSGTFAGHQRRY